MLKKNLACVWSGLFLAIFVGSTMSLFEQQAFAATIPSPPTNLVPTSNTTNAIPSVNLTWTASPGATIYTIYRASSSSGPWTIMAGISTTTSFTDTSIMGGNTYYYKITATDSAGTSSLSSTVSATIPASLATLTMNLMSSNEKISVFLEWMTVLIVGLIGIPFAWVILGQRGKKNSN